MSSAPPRDSFLRAPRDLSFVPDERIAGVIDRRLRTVRQHARGGRRDRALALIRPLLKTMVERLPCDEDLIGGLCEVQLAVENFESGQPREVRRRVSLVRWAIRDAVRVARAWRPPKPVVIAENRASERELEREERKVWRRKFAAAGFRRRRWLEYMAEEREKDRWGRCRSLRDLEQAVVARLQKEDVAKDD